IGWGHQIRSYVLQPYQLVKDLRTGVESTNPNAVLDGALAQAHEVQHVDRARAIGGAKRGEAFLGGVDVVGHAMS
ncbi:MAG TPA: hypothetical protein VGQ97_02590, partial [Xanthobacteraceae bacterium]|nr:hypothetical protein [Xanthobacteraceae bacterium]